jgi:hypothetical protein
MSNPALDDLAFLAGEWATELSNSAFLPDPKARISAAVRFDWVADGAALMMRQGNRPPSPPAATWIIGRDEGREGYTVLYNDARGVSRIYEMTFSDNRWKMWRNNPRFSQRFEGTVSRDSKQIVAYWEKSTDGGKTWEHDFDLTYRR